MAYGSIKVDNITFTNGGVDQTVTVSGIVQSISGNITATGTIQGATIIGTSTVSGAVVSGNAGVFTTATITSGVFDQGSAAAPSISFSGDLDTGIYSPTTNTVAVATAGSGQIFIDPSGRVGVNTSTSLLFPVNIQADSGAGSIMIRGRAADNKANLLFVNSGAAANTGQLSADNDGVSIATGATPTERFRADAAGQLQAGSLGTASAPVWSFAADKNTGIYSPGADQLALATNGTQRLLIEADGDINIDSGGVFYDATNNRLAIGTTSPGYPLDVQGDSSGAGLRIRGGSGGLSAIQFTDNALSAQWGVINTTASSCNIEHTSIVRFSAGGSERARIDSSGRLLVGTSSALSNISIAGTLGAPTFQVQGATGAAAGAVLTRTTAGSAFLTFNAGSSGNNVASGNGIGNIQFNGFDGTNYINGASISAAVDGTPGTNDMPGRLMFSTTADGSASPTERLRITSDGKVGIGVTSPGAPLDVNGSVRAGNYHILDGSTSAAGVVGFSTSNGPSLEFWGSAAAGGGSLIAKTAGSERARIDSSGRLLVGASSATAGGAFLQIQGAPGTATDPGAIILRRGETAANITAGEVIGQLLFQSSDGGGFGSIQIAADGTAGVSDFPGRLVFSTTADGAASPTERMRITSNGAIATFAANVASLAAMWVGSAGTANTSQYLLIGSYGATGVSSGTTSFLVFNNGNVQNTNNSYAGISDIKLKENIVDANSQWDDLKALQIRNYNFKEGQTHTQIGLIAQEVELVSPGLVSESPDRDEEGNDLGTVTKSVNYSVLYMKAVKALQEAMERIETLEASNADLLARVSVLEQG